MSSNFSTLSSGRLLITGGAGFVGSNLAVSFKRKYPKLEVVALDNLKRRGSELNINRLKNHGIEFIHGDIRNKEDLSFQNRNIGTIIECSAEPSVLAGYGGSPEYLINSNLVGAINCLEAARKHQAAFIFLSTSRVYPMAKINQLHYQEEETRFSLLADQPFPGASENGISENFPLEGSRSLYGATKLSAELLAAEYAEMYDIKSVINRCGVIAGPWQMGKVDQGVFTLWMAAHYFKKDLRYIGFGGSGKQVRDLLHIDDLFDLLDYQIQHPNQFHQQIYNIGGGLETSLSLVETTGLCEEITGNKISIRSEKANRPADIRSYISDCAKIKAEANWRPERSARQILIDIHNWIHENETALKNILR
ncbi:MAG: NAD-dependent epimerase/dehydratase family protein [Calditrichae bacterium]|nr:NAD-dependent epimerase/dehydratase family protein [Calditrichia bacterium]